MQYTDDPVADYEAYDREQQRWLDKCPICAHCKQHIQDEEYYSFNLDGEIEPTIICSDCLRDYCDENFAVSNPAY